MRDWSGKRYWLVGASEGLGAALAHQLSRAGAEVVVSARTKDRLEDLTAALPGRARAVPCDVSDRESVESAAHEIGEVDGLVYLAAVYWPMHARDWNATQVEAMCDVNFTGAARTLGAVVPGMIERDRGHVVLTGSLSGFRGLPGAVGYAASKAGVMVLAESLHADLRGSGVQVQLVNPGFIRTRTTAKNDFKMAQIMEPEDAARRMFEFMGGDGFKTSFPHPFASLFRGGQFLPDWAWYGLLPKR